MSSYKVEKIISEIPWKKCQPDKFVGGLGLENARQVITFNYRLNIFGP